MTSLGNLFPDSVKKDFSNRIIEPGAVFRIHVNNTNPPKIKRLVVLAISGDKACVGYLFLNSQINPNVFPSPALRDLHLFLEASEREYLDHDSYLDCSDIKDMDIHELNQIIFADPSRHIGNLHDGDLEAARGKIKNAPTISKKQKRKYGLA